MKELQPNSVIPNVYTLVQSFNRRNLLEISVSSFKKVLGNDERFHMFVYDAGSSDGSLEYLRDLNEDLGMSLRVIESPSGLSFSAGHNRLLQELDSDEVSGALVLFYETDNAVLNRQAIDEAIEIMQTGEADAVGFTPRKHDGTGAGYGGDFPTKREFILGQRLTRNLRNYKKRSANKIQNYFETEVAFTSPLLVKHDTLKRIDGFDADHFPFGHSDTDLCQRIRDIGGKIVVLRSESFIHDNLENASEWSKNRVRDYHRATFRLLEKHGQPFSLSERTLLFGRHSIELAALASLAPFSTVSQRKIAGRLELLKECFSGYETPK